MRKILQATMAMGLLAACVTSGASPHDMSASGHQAASNDADQKAAAHQGQYSADAVAVKERCPQSARTGGVAPLGTDLNYLCWTSVTNPTEHHRAEAEQQRRAAAEHRAASAVLKETEARACVGIEPDDRDISPFFHREDIERVELEPQGSPARRANQPEPAVIGATVYFVAVPGLTVDRFQHLIDCHLARNAVLGHDLPEMNYCPLVPRNVAATVKATAHGFAVTMTSSDPRAAAEVAKRAEGLVASKPHASTQSSVSQGKRE